MNEEMTLEEMPIEEKIMMTIEDGDRNIITLLWALTGIININSNFGTLPEIEDIIKDLQSTHKEYPQKPRRCKQVCIESMHAILEKWKITHEIG